MYFITEKTSETGKKFQAISEQKKIAIKAQKELANKYNFSSYRKAYWCVFGGMSSCLNFSETPDSKIWKKNISTSEYYPKKSTKEGKLIWQEIQDLPVVDIEDLNMCVGFDGAPFNTIGFADNNKKYFGFEVDIKWGVKIPKDCEEVLESKYNSLFK
jgi:hypothetical protein